MEREFFDWDGWDGDQECMTFYNVVLKKQFGQFPPGTEFDAAVIEWNVGVLQFYNHGEFQDCGNTQVASSTLMGEYKIGLVVK